MAQRSRVRRIVLKPTKKLLSAAILLTLLVVAFAACTRGVNEPIPIEGQMITLPRQIDWTPRVATTIAAGALSSFVIQTDGSLWGWGIFGEVVFGKDENIQPPNQPHRIPVKLMEGVEAVSAGGWTSDGSHVMVLQSNGSLWGLGKNSHGQLGDGTTNDRNEFVKIMDDVIALSTGGFHTMAIRTDGSLWAWGGNWSGQLGDGATTDRHTPVRIMDNVLAVAGGITHTMAITADNVLWGWGSNGSGRLGYDATANEHNPIHPNPLRIMDAVAAVSAGLDHTMAIKTDGSLWVWGNNSRGRLGGGPIDATLTLRPGASPIRIMDNVKVIAAGDMYSMAITADGVLWAWGFNAGWVTLGIGSRDTAILDVDRPLRVMDDVVTVSTWVGHAIAVRADGSAWTWGRNDAGELGDGTFDNRGKPLQIMANVRGR